MQNLNTERRLVWRQDSHAATVRSFGRNSYGLVWSPSLGIFAAVEIPVAAQQRRRPAYAYLAPAVQTSPGHVVETKSDALPRQA